jgi:hypothetical protein
MKKLFILCFLSMLHLMLAAQDQVLVDANASVRALKGDFNKIKISNNIKLILNQSATVALAVSASQEKYTNDIKTVVENNMLTIYCAGGNSWNKKDRDLTVYLSFKELNELEVSGASNVVMIGKIHSEELKIQMSGASSIKAQVDIKSLAVQLSGASEADLNGEAHQLRVDCSGASDIHAYGLMVESCNIKASGASDIQISVNKELSVDASGASHIYYKGNAELANVKSSGVSEVSKKY